MVLYARGEPEKIRQLKKSAEDLNLEIALYSELPLQDNVVSRIANLPTQSNISFVRLRHSVKGCGYEWNYKGKLKNASCPGCLQKVNVEKYRVS